MSGDNETKEALNRGGVSPMFQHWVAQALGVVDSELTIHAIAGDASPRRYFRVTRNVGPCNALAYRPEGASDELITVDAVIAAASPPSENNSAFLAVQLLLEQSGLSVPRQFANDLEQGFFLMEDFGDKLLMTANVRHSNCIHICTLSFRLHDVARGFLPATWGSFAIGIVSSPYRFLLVRSWFICRPSSINQE